VIFLGGEIYVYDYTNSNTNPKTHTTFNLTLTDPHDAFKAFVRRYFVTLGYAELFGVRPRASI